MKTRKNKTTKVMHHLSITKFYLFFKKKKKKTQCLYQEVTKQGHRRKHTVSFSNRKCKHLCLNSTASFLEIPVPEQTLKNIWT